MAETEKTSINETENQPLDVEAALVDQAREISRGRIHDMPRWME